MMADPNAGIDEIIADTYEGLGFHARAAMVREGIDPHDGCADPPYVQLIDDIGEVLGEVPANTDRHAHVDDARAEYGPDGRITKKAVVACWRTRAQCLADRIRGMIDDGSLRK